ncbi:hypothetical protein J6590_070488 [Homalodisca vitripennis]|nr:hypothetical protein J6590_070488 [Homalodisca vitripennis]
MNRTEDPAGKKHGPEDKRCKFSQKNRVEWAIKSFKPFKALGADGIFPNVGGNIGSVFQLALVRKQISWDKCGFPTIDGGNIGLVSQLALVRKQHFHSTHFTATVFSMARVFTVTSTVVITTAGF